MRRSVKPESSWTDTAVVLLNDSEKGKVVIGPRGFVWWEGSVCNIAPFQNEQKALVSAFYWFDRWKSVQAYTSRKVSTAAVYRFVKYGYLPG